MHIDLDVGDLQLLIHALQSHIELRKMKGGSGYWQDRKQAMELMVKLAALRSTKLPGEIKDDEVLPY